MSEKQLLHEINSSWEATEEIRKQVLQAKKRREEKHLSLMLTYLIKTSDR